MKTALLRTAALAFAAYLTAYFALYLTRTPAAKNPGGQLAYWCYIDGTQTKQERFAYTVFWPLYRVHKWTLGLGSIHVLDPEG